MFKLNRKNGVSYYTITSFEKTGLVKHGFSTREGGVSDGCYSSMNFRFHCDDTRENVLKNFEIMADTLGMDYNKLVLSKQVHEDVIHTVTEDDFGKFFYYTIIILNYYKLFHTGGIYEANTFK